MRSTGPIATNNAAGARAGVLVGGRILFSKLFLIIFVFVFFITLIYALVTTSISTGIIREDAFDNSTAFLTKVSNLMENRIDGIGNSWIRLCNSLDASAIDGMILDPYGRYELQKDMDSFASSFPGVDSMYFFFDGGRSVFFNSYTTTVNYTIGTGGFFDKEVYYDFIKGNKLFAIYGARRISPVFNIGGMGTLYASDVLTMVRRFPVNAADSPNLTALNIKSDYFLQAIDENYMPQDSIVLVSDAGGNVLLTYYSGGETIGRIKDSDIAALSELRASQAGPFNMVVNGEKCYAAEVRADGSGRIYTLIMPVRLLLAPVSRVNMPVFLLINVMLVLSIVFSKLVEMRFYNPILRILNLLKSNDKVKPPEGNEFKQIDGYINRMLDDNALRQKQLQSYFSLYRERIMHSLLTGDEEGQRLLEGNGIAVGGEYRLVCAVVVNLRAAAEEPAAEADMANLVSRVADALAEALNRLGRTEKVRLGARKTCLLLFLDGFTDTGALKSIIQAFPFEAEFGRELEPRGWKLRAGVGGLYDSIKSAAQSFTEAEESLDCASSDGLAEVCGPADIPDRRRGRTVYPYELEEKILAEVESGEVQFLRSDLERFSSRLRESGTGVKGARKQYLLLLDGVARRLGARGMIKERDQLQAAALEELDRLPSPDSMRAWALETLERCIANMRQGIINNRELIEKVQKYLSVHFTDDIGLNTIASYVHLSPSYLGKLFREIAGCTFTDYLIRIRMEEAARLLVHTGARITDIVDKAGYFSIQSFNRAFRGYFSCSPSDYRKKFAGKELDGED